MPNSIAIFGGTGFVGRVLLERWPDRAYSLPRFFVHRSRPHWLKDERAEVRTIDLADPRSVKSALNGISCAINLLRPDGTGWLRSTMQRLTPLFQEGSVTRIIHASSIDVYGMAPERLVTEDTPVRPHSSYQREHADLEAILSQIPMEVLVLRLGAVFGQHGRNLEGLASEMLAGSQIFPALRRALYANRRMHLVSVENVADVILMLATNEHRHAGSLTIVTDDSAPENNFASVQDIIADAYGRAPLTWVPSLPRALLRQALSIRERPDADADRRFSNDALSRTGFRPQMPFPDRVHRYAQHMLARQGALGS